MTKMNYPSQVLVHRHLDMAVHAVGLILIVIAGSVLIFKAIGEVENSLVFAVVVYVICALTSNLASWAYHFLSSHDHRKLLRRIDHAAIYPSISGTFTPFFVQAGTTLTMTLLWVCWGLTALAVQNKITNGQVKSRWSTASYLALGGIGLFALIDLKDAPTATLWCVAAGAFCYVIGITFYVRKSMPFRYAIWHSWVNFGGMLMFAAIWVALFQ
ncbi:PAQR family membrane homeostasis protein TrhA [Parasulfitobacter algicola]|uniref:Hemolysin III family protein n=1 Tax=Parasulfitobacter algicola TaxID=2614809 RepID=A0ABX2IS56_9RHOB|nr:hemolysin III family protein [Sulfitobacter algicola]NSX55729.1 hemolysin III family protein [Sulfitobacter algicola]